MKICLCANGSSIHTKRWINYFVDRGHEVHLVSNISYKYKSSKFHILKNYTNNRHLNFFGYCLQIKKIINKIKPDIIHSHYATTYGFLGALSGFHPLIVSVWGSDVLVEPKNSKVFDFFTRYALKKADLIIPMATPKAEFMKNYLIKSFCVPEDKIQRIPWGIDPTIFKRGYKQEVEKLRENLKIQKNTKIILSARHMDPKYGIKYLIKVIPYLTKKYPNTKLIILRGGGSKEYENKMKNLSSKLRVSDKIIFIQKHINTKEMCVYLNLADIFVSLTKTDQFACSLMEGMACGTIPIVSNIEVYQQYLKNKKNALFVEPENPKDIAEKIIYCFKHPEIKNKFYKINRKIIEKDEDWNKNARKMEELYKKLIKLLW